MFMSLVANRDRSVYMHFQPALFCINPSSYFIRFHKIYKNRQIYYILIKIMIATTRISKYIGFSWLQLCSRFGSEKLKSIFSQRAQRAVWASMIMKMICSSKGSNNIMDPSLREKIVNLQYPEDAIDDPEIRQKILKADLIFDDEIRIKIFKIFIDGAFLSRAAFKQQRITDSKQPGSQKQNKRKFVFCPNYLVTQPIFSKLRWEQSNMLIYGGFGIGKTAALIIFNYLSAIINEFIYKSSSEQWELNLLRNLNLLTEIPKLFYWSLDLKFNQSSLKSLIIAQATELSEQQRIQLLKIVKFQQFFYSLHKKYDVRGITVRAVIDQINFLAAVFRKWNYFCMTNPVGSKEWAEQQLIMKKQIKEGQILLSRIQQIMKISDSTFFNSSANIEDELLERQIYSGIKTLDLQNGHVRLNKFQVPYFENLKTASGCNDFTHIFWLSIENILKRNNIGQLQLNKLKNIFYQQLKHKKWPIYVRFLNISNMLNKDYNVFFGQNIETKFSQTNFKQTTNELAQSLKTFSIEQYQQNLKKFIKKTAESEQTQREKLFFLNVMLKIAEQSNQTSEQCLQIDIRHFESKLFYDIQSHDKISLPFLHKQLFQTEQFISMTKIKFLFTAKEFIEITKDIINQETMHYFGIDPKLVLYFLKISKSSQGSLMKFTLIQILRRVGTEFKFQIRRLNDLPLKLQFKTMFSTNYLQMNKSQQHSISQHLHGALQLAKNNPNQYIFASPTQIDIKGKVIYQDYADTSKCFDFAFIILNTQSTPIYEIYTFDATITSSLHENLTDAKILLPKMTNFPTILDTPYKIMHIIICDKHIKIVNDQKGIWQIATSTFETIKLSVRDKQSQKILANCQQQLSIYQLVKRMRNAMSEVKSNKN